MNRNEDILDALAFLADHAEGEEGGPEAADLAAKTARIAAFLKAEGVADVLAAIRDGADVAVDCRDGDPTFATRRRELRLLSQNLTLAIPVVYA